MSTPILTTKLYIPPPRPNAILRPHLLRRLNESLEQKLTLISAPAGFGKTTLVSTWVAQCQRPISWLSLDEEHNDPIRFLAYLVAALQTITPTIGNRLLPALQSPQPPPPESILTSLLNEIATTMGSFILVLDDYHTIDAKPVDAALVFLVENLPPQMHLVIATRQDPPLPLARLRARHQLTELRAADLRFTLAETTGFLNQVMGLNLVVEEVAALEKRTEGWVAGLQLAALALQGTFAIQNVQGAAGFIQSFTGSHRFVLDYLLEEVLQRQPQPIQIFLLHTAILDRLCGPLCDALVLDSAVSGQETLSYLEQANLFIVPLDDERRWYRYHHLFADLLRQRLHQQYPNRVAELNGRASRWYEENNLEIEAFHHATAAFDVDRAARLIEGKGMPLQFRGAAVPIIEWLASLPTAELDARPMLWVTYASALLAMGRVAGVAEKAQAAETALQHAPPGNTTHELMGRIASIRVTVAVTQHQAETIITQAGIALAHLPPANLPVRASITWALGYAYMLRGERLAAGAAYAEALSVCQKIGHTVIGMMAAIGLGSLQELDNHLNLATQTYHLALELAGDPPRPPACDAYLGLARICYEWNDLEAAHRYGQQATQLARQIENTDRFVNCELFLVRVKLAQGDVAGAAMLLAQTNQMARQQKFERMMPEITAVYVLVLLRQGDVTTAAQLAQSHSLPMSQARAYLAQEDATAALAVLQPWRQQVEARGWQDEQLRVMVLQAVAQQAKGEMETAVNLLCDALTLAAPGGFVRTFVDEGPPMAHLLAEAARRGTMPEYTHKLLATFVTETQKNTEVSSPPKLLVEPLSQRELEILQLIAQGLSNHEIGKQLFLALDTVKGHNRRIFDKLQVQRRTEAVARARELGLL